MRKNARYIRLKELAIDGDYTVEQVRNATYNQIRNLLGLQNLSENFINTAKRKLIIALNNRDDTQIMADLRSVALTWLNNNFPDFEAERGREDDKPYVTIWLKGKPDY